MEYKDCGYSWENSYGEELCHTCAQLWLPGMAGARIRAVYVKGAWCAGYWEARNQDEAMALGIPPRCCHCNNYLTNYFVVCVANREDLWAPLVLENCCCRKCRPTIYRNNDILADFYMSMGSDDTGGIH